MERRTPVNNELPSIMTVSDTCAYLRCSRQHVYDMIENGYLKTYTVGGRRYIDVRSLARQFR